MLDFAMHTQIVRSFEHFDARRLDLKLLERQTRALEAIASQLGSISAYQPLPPEAQPQYALATRRLLEEAI